MTNHSYSRLVQSLAATVILSTLASLVALGQQQPSRTPRDQALLDLTGYWVSIVTEDWRWRMVTPPKGDYASVPLNPAGRKVADTWDPAKDQAEGNQCKAYGIGGLMRMPTRVHITWEDENALKIETDAGSQTRTLRFSAPPPSPPSLQGQSVASWDLLPQGGRAGGGGGNAGRQEPQPPRGALKVITANVIPGYLRKNGVPYSEKAVVTEYFDRHAAYGTEYFTVVTIVDDPTYLSQPFVTSSHFKQEPDGAKFHPMGCEVTLPSK